MVDRVDLNVQALGALALRTGEHGAEIGDTRTVHDPGPAFVNAVAVHTHTFGQNMPEPPFELFNDEKTPDRAWRYPYLGGDVAVARESALAGVEREHARQTLIGSEGVRDPVNSGVNAVTDRDPLNPLYSPLRYFVTAAAPESAPALVSGADLARSMAGLIASERAFQASAKAIRTVEQTSGSLMDAFA
ncbi:MAG: flagellar basal body rod C-terminal domain-containing protein [Thermodesulfobacteriota bacterium]